MKMVHCGCLCLTGIGELEYHFVCRIFFSACDGFFTNYNWTEQSLESMRDYAEVQGRQADIYVGVDVFARGKVVGGKFETNKVSTMRQRCRLKRPAGWTVCASTGAGGHSETPLLCCHLCSWLGVWDSRQGRISKESGQVRSSYRWMKKWMSLIAFVRRCILSAASGLFCQTISVSIGSPLLFPSPPPSARALAGLSTPEDRYCKELLHLHAHN